MSYCCRLNICIPSKFICWILINNVIELGEGPLGDNEVLMRPWRWGLHDGVSAFIKRDQGACSLSAMWWDIKKSAICKPRRGGSPELNMLASWSQTSRPPELWVITFYSMVFCYSSLICLKQLVKNLYTMLFFCLHFSWIWNNVLNILIIFTW